MQKLQLMFLIAQEKPFSVLFNELGGEISGVFASKMEVFVFGYYNIDLLKPHES